MDIVFGSKNLERLCHDDVLATSTLGRVGARKLRARLDDLRAIVSLASAPKLPGRFHPVPGNAEGHYAFDLHAGQRLVLRPERASSHDGGGPPLNLAEVTTVSVISVEKRND